MDRSTDAHDAPLPRRGLAGRGAALLCIADRRAELATMLVLQELDVSVDLAADVETAVRWARQAHYDLIVAADGAPAAASLALRFRHVSTRARIVLVADEWQLPEALDHLDAIDVEVLRPPLDVNTLMHHLWPAA